LWFTNRIELDLSYKELVTAFLPGGILEYFDVSNVSRESEGLCIYLEERNILPQEYIKELYHSKGFYPETRIQDFPIRGKKVYLCIKRRRWEHQQTGAIVSRDWKLVQSGTRMTAEFAAFLKGLFG
jgi:hypothetical protein